MAGAGCGHLIDADSALVSALGCSAAPLRVCDTVHRAIAYTRLRQCALVIPG